MEVLDLCKRKLNREASGGDDQETSYPQIERRGEKWRERKCGGEDERR